MEGAGEAAPERKGGGARERERGRERNGLLGLIAAAFPAPPFPFALPFSLHLPVPASSRQWLASGRRIGEKTRRNQRRPASFAFGLYCCLTCPETRLPYRQRVLLRRVSKAVLVCRQHCVCVCVCGGKAQLPGLPSSDSSYSFLFHPPSLLSLLSLTFPSCSQRGVAHHARLCRPRPRRALAVCGMPMRTVFGLSLFSSFSFFFLSPALPALLPSSPPRATPPLLPPAPFSPPPSPARRHERG